MKRVRRKPEPVVTISQQAQQPEWLVLDEYTVDAKTMLVVALPETGEVRCVWATNYEEAT